MIEPGMTEQEKELINLMLEIDMNRSTVIGVLQATKTQEQVQQTIDYIKRYKWQVTDFSLRDEILTKIAPKNK